MLQRLTLRRGGILALLATLAAPTFAVVDLDKLSDKEFDKLPKEQLSEVAVTDLFARIAKKQRGEPVLARRVAIASVQIYLSDLKYFSGTPSGQSSPELESAIKAFQRDAKFKQTGVVTFAQMDLLKDRSAKITEQQPLSLPPKIVDGSKEFAMAKGTWVFEGDEQAFPLQTTSITCYRQTMDCRSVQAEVGSYNHLGLYEETYTISKWTAAEVVAENQAQCVAYTLQISLAKKEANMFRRGLGGTGCEDVATKPQILHLVDGWKVATDYYSERREAGLAAYERAYGETLREFHNGVEKLFASGKKK
jgi:peptidoglycan hydrolase-like protein with peptidoglycan-binding domain